MIDRKLTLALLLRYLDSEVTEDEGAFVEEQLRREPKARKMLRDIAQQAVVVADVARVHRSVRAEREIGAPIRSGRRWLLMAAAGALVAVTWSFYGRTAEPKIITVKAVHGPVEWIGSGGVVTEKLSVGATLPGGTIELMSVDSWVEFEFLDRSKVGLFGQSVITFSEVKQKVLRLRRGSLSANVQPQPAGQPMLVHTPSADLKVLGTQFNVDALPESTHLAVNEGRVSLKRLIDGSEVEVVAKHAATVSMQVQEGVSVLARPRAVSVWKSDLRTDAVCGKWLPDQWLLGQRLKKSVASGELNRTDAMELYKRAAELDTEGGTVWAVASPYGSLVVLAVAQASATPVVIRSDARICVRGRLHSLVPVKFGITTKKSAGGFGGKYCVSVDVDALRGGDNSFEIELPLREFVEVTAFGDSPVGKELSDWWCVAESTAAKFEITSVELSD